MYIVYDSNGHVITECDSEDEARELANSCDGWYELKEN